MFHKKHKELPPLFYCDNCGAEVSQDASACPKCGRKFASIRCPACGFSGEEDLFNNGCPKCGYQVLPGKGRHKNKNIMADLRRRGGKVAYTFNSSGSSNSPNSSDSPGSLPAWVYFLALAVFIFVLTFLFLYISR